MAVTRRGLEFRMVLDANVPGMRILADTGQFHDFAQTFGRRTRRHDQACLFYTAEVMVVCPLPVTYAPG